MTIGGGEGLLIFFQENEEVAIEFEGICLISLVSCIWLVNVATKSWSLMKIVWSIYLVFCVLYANQSLPIAEIN
jgi:steroid 5-alpha reductase family enzyme